MKKLATIVRETPAAATTPTPAARPARKAAPKKAAPKKAARAKAGRATSKFAGMTRSERMKKDPDFRAKAIVWRTARRERTKAWRKLGQQAQLVLDHGDAKALRALIAAAVKAKAAADGAPARKPRAAKAAAPVKAARAPKAKAAAPGTARRVVKPNGEVVVS